MKQNMQLTTVTEREGDGFVSLCPELDVASQGSTMEEARANLAEAVELLLQVADETEISRRFSGESHDAHLRSA